MSSVRHQRGKLSNVLLVNLEQKY